ncbi:hypothetical protein [Bradyrhizobium sp. 1]|uniref:hypothetical protein n=1 Tax=Bradyrhizobium sp. 1 TaxID=241591 RepID=UPI001FF9F2B6|nr:hypothetical protein [Bradyrhizobium sp. 1]MCK1391178.1 hypothetical protein [Bradyrhizobium sp. 1]
MSRQIGGFLGADEGGAIYDALGSYTMVWMTLISRRPGMIHWQWLSLLLSCILR